MEGGDLARLWKGGKKGCLSPIMQAKAWGLSEAGVRQVDIAAKLEKIGGGHPTQSAVSKLLLRIKGDPEGKKSASAGRVPKRSNSRGQWSGPWDACGGASWGVPRDASWVGSWNAP